MGILVIKDTKVVQKQLHENAQVFPKGHTYYYLVNGWGVIQTEWHDKLNKSPLISNECCFLSFLLNYHNLMVA
jgi:hypothetical protein